MTPGNRRVLIIGSAWPLRGGGIATFNERLATAYTAQGDQVTIFSFSLQYPSFLFPGKSQYTEEPAPDNIDIRVLINSVNPLNWLHAARIIRHEKADLIIVRFWIPFMAPCLGTIARLVKRHSKTRVVAITDNIVPHEKRPFDRLLARYFTGSVDAFVTMSKSVLADLSNFDQVKPRKYYPHPLYDNFGDPVPKSVARQKLGLPVEGRLMLFFGFIRDYKGLDLLLEAMAQKQIKELNAKLLIAGEYYGNQEKYESLISKLNLSGLIEAHTSFIPNTEVYLYFCACDVVVQPYRNATQSGVTQVAYHFGKPMITTNVGGLSEMVQHGKVGFVVEPDVDEIANAIHTFYHNNLEEEFSKNVVCERERFSWEGLLESISEVVFTENLNKN